MVRYLCMNWLKYTLSVLLVLLTYEQRRAYTSLLPLSSLYVHWRLSCVQEESMVRYISPVNPAVYPHLAVTLLSIGLFFMAWFFVYPHAI